MTSIVAEPTVAVQTDERNFRPLTLKEFVGQSAIKEALELMLESAKKRGTTREHVCFFGGPGLEKTTLAQVIANEMGGALRELSAPALMKLGDLVIVLILLGQNDVLFLDEMHALKREISEVLYSAMEKFRVGIPFTVHPGGRDHRLRLAARTITRPLQPDFPA